MMSTYSQGFVCTRRYVSYFIERVDMLLHNGITPYVVFDGGPLPMKKGTETERRAYVPLSVGPLIPTNGTEGSGSLSSAYSMR